MTTTHRAYVQRPLRQRIASAWRNDRSTFLLVSGLLAAGIVLFGLAALLGSI